MDEHHSQLIDAHTCTLFVKYNVPEERPWRELRFLADQRHFLSFSPHKRSVLVELWHVKRAEPLHSALVGPLFYYEQVVCDGRQVFLFNIILYLWYFNAFIIGI